MAETDPNVSISWDWADNNGKKGTTKITEINPQAANDDLIDFANMLNEFTGNTRTSFVQKTTKVTLYKDT